MNRSIPGDVVVPFKMDFPANFLSSIYNDLRARSQRSIEDNGTNVVSSFFSVGAISVAAAAVS
jgi:hypothetical protein